MIELSIPQAGEETKNAKDLVFSILSEQQPLSIIQLVNIIHKQYNLGLTYQAVKKAADSLEQKHVLLKNARLFSINRQWLLDLKVKVEKMLASLENAKHTGTFKAEMAGGEYAVYTFTNLLDMDNFWDDMLIHLADNLKDEPRVFISRTHFSWWMLINLGRETKLFQHLQDKGIATYNLNVGNYALNRWAGVIYQDFGTHFKVGKDPSLDESISLNVIGDTVIQVKYPPHLVKKLRLFFTRYKSTQEMSHKEITQLVHESGEIKFNVFRNKEIAQSLRDRYLKKFS